MFLLWEDALKSEQGISGGRTVEELAAAASTAEVFWVVKVQPDSSSRAGVTLERPAGGLFCGKNLFPWSGAEEGAAVSLQQGDVCRHQRHPNRRGSSLPPSGRLTTWGCL